MSPPAANLPQSPDSPGTPLGGGTAGMLLVIAGPSGVGKTTITHHVERQLGAVFSVSVTTRPRTDADVEGRDYLFVERPAFERMRDAGELLEWAEVFGHCYGTPRQAVERTLAQGRLMILEIDVQGTIQIKRLMPEAFAVFVLPPSEAVLLDRLRNRAREDEATIQRRFREARNEIATARACGAFDVFIVNDRIDDAVRQATDIVRREWDRRRTTGPPRAGGP